MDIATVDSNVVAEEAGDDDEPENIVLGEEAIDDEEEDYGYIRKTGISFCQLLNVFFSFFTLSVFVPLDFLEKKKPQG